MGFDIEKLSLSGKMKIKEITEGKQIIEDLKEATKDPMKLQEAFLMEWLQKNKDTEYGKKYHFDQIKSIEDYKKMVPITGFDDYAEYISREADGCEKNLICVEDMLCYAKTSGTVGVPKKIPTTVYHKAATGRYNSNYQYALVANAIGMDWIDSKSYSILECPRDITITKNGLPHCAVSAVSLNSLKGNPILSELFVSPEEAIISKENTDTKYIHALFGLMDANITYFTATFSSFMLNLFRYVEKNWEMLLSDMENGTINEFVKMDEDVRESLLQKIKPMPERAAELRTIFEKGFDEPVATKIWPKLAYTACVATASFEPYYKKMRKYLGDVPNYFFGIGASEGFFTVPYELGNPDGVFIPNINFYEFLPEEADGDMSQAITLEEVEVGKEYELVVTNLSGFYRYRMRDIVKITGMYNQTPTAQFIRRIDKTISVMGEKTTETALRDVVYSTAEQCGFDVVDFSVYPDTDSDPAGYVFFMETENMPEDYDEEKIRNVIEENLARANPSMGDKVKHGTCAPSRVRYLQPETYLLYQEVMYARGANRSQLKPVSVIGNEFQRKFFSTLSAEKYADSL